MENSDVTSAGFREIFKVILFLQERHIGDAMFSIHFIHALLVGL